MTHALIFQPPSTLDEALAQVDMWLESPTLVVLGERMDHWAHLRRLLQEGNVYGARVHDTRVAATCLAHGVTVLWTADRDFSRFPQLRTTTVVTSMQRYALAGLFSLISVSLALIAAWSALEGGRAWVVALPAGVIALWMGDLARRVWPR